MRARFQDADAVVFGHSHLPLHEQAPTASRSSTPARRPSAAARPSTRWGSRRSRTAARGSSSWSLTRPRADPARHGLSLFFAGTAGSVPDRAPRAARRCCCGAGGDRLLFDCGEGTQQQLLRSVGLPELDAIFITHYHLDHWLGLLGMLKTFDLRGRERPLRDLRPARAAGAARAPCGRRAGGSSYPLALEELDPHEEVALRRLRDRAVPGRAPRARLRLRVRRGRPRPGRFDAEAAARLGRQAGPGLRPPPARRDGRRRLARAGRRASRGRAAAS